MNQVDPTLLSDPSQFDDKVITNLTRVSSAWTDGPAVGPAIYTLTDVDNGQVWLYIWSVYDGAYRGFGGRCATGQCFTTECRYTDDDESNDSANWYCQSVECACVVVT
jgi:hypothetical protein